jgi:hypothetical protein
VAAAAMGRRRSGTAESVTQADTGSAAVSWAVSRALSRRRTVPPTRWSCATSPVKSSPGWASPATSSHSSQPPLDSSTPTGPGVASPTGRPHCGRGPTFTCGPPGL